MLDYSFNMLNLALMFASSQFLMYTDLNPLKHWWNGGNGGRNLLAAENYHVQTVGLDMIVTRIYKFSCLAIYRIKKTGSCRRVPGLQRVWCLWGEPAPGGPTEKPAGPTIRRRCARTLPTESYTEEERKKTAEQTENRGFTDWMWKCEETLSCICLFMPLPIRLNSGRTEGGSYEHQQVYSILFLFINSALQ